MSSPGGSFVDCVAGSVIAKATSCHAEVQVVDSSDFESVVALAKRLEGDPLDILVANAGVVHNQYHGTKDGWEETYVSCGLIYSTPSLWVSPAYKSITSQLRCFVSFSSPIF